MRLSDNLFQYLTLIFVAVVCALDHYADGLIWPALALCLALGLAYQFWPWWWKPHLQLAVQMLLISSLILLQSVAMVLGFTFAVYAATLFPDRRGALWIVGMAVIIGLGIVWLLGWQEGLIAAVGVSMGLASFGFFTYARIQAEVERLKSQQLLGELQETHRQLKDYAGRVEELAVAEERNRLAREMHDSLGHRLTVAAVQLEGAQRLVSSEPERAERMIRTVRQQVVEALAELRRTVAALRTPLNAGLPLTLSFAQLAQDFEDATGLPVHLDLPEEMDGLTSLQQTAIYRAAQEGLTNVQRHARASQVWLSLACAEEGVVLAIADDGLGYPAQQESQGFGLRGLSERAILLGGELTLGTRPGGGAQLTLRLPLTPAEDYALEAQKANDG